MVGNRTRDELIELLILGESIREKIEKRLKLTMEGGYSNYFKNGILMKDYEADSFELDTPIEGQTFDKDWKDWENVTIHGIFVMSDGTWELCVDDEGINWSHFSIDTLKKVLQVLS